MSDDVGLKISCGASIFVVACAVGSVDSNDAVATFEIVEIMTLGCTRV